MIDHFRSLLLNETYDTEGEIIPPNFVARTLPANLKGFYDLLFPPALTRAEKLYYAFNYLNLIRSCGLEEAFTLKDHRITYDLDGDFDYFKTENEFDFTQVFNRIASNNTTVNLMLNARPNVPCVKYENLWKQHPNPVYKLSGLITAYVCRLE